MRTIKQQNGASFLGILIILAMSAAIGLFGMKVLPLYIENSSVNAALDALIGVPNIGKKGRGAMIKRLDGQFNIDDVQSLVAKDVKYIKSKTSKVWIVTADYEAKTNLASNVFVVIHFVKTVEVPR